jgi:hypothetical protein
MHDVTEQSRDQCACAARSSCGISWSHGPIHHVTSRGTVFVLSSRHWFRVFTGSQRPLLTPPAYVQASQVVSSLRGFGPKLHRLLISYLWAVNYNRSAADADGVKWRYWLSFIRLTVGDGKFVSYCLSLFGLELLATVKIRTAVF